MSQEAQTAVLQDVMDQGWVFRATSHLRNGIPGLPPRITIGAKPADPPQPTQEAPQPTSTTEETAPAPPQGTTDQRRLLPEWAKAALVGASLAGIPGAGVVGYLMSGGKTSQPVIVPPGSTSIVEAGKDPQEGIVRWMIDRGYNLPSRGK